MTQSLTDWSAAVVALVDSLTPSVVSAHTPRGRPRASGIAWKSDGLFVLPAHAVEREDSLEVTLHDGREVRAQLLGADHTTDISLWKTDATFTIAPRAESSTLKLGEWVLNLSRPGRSLRVRSGILSARAGEWTSPTGGKLDAYLETDIVPRPGFSGGVIANSAGKVLGLSTSGLIRHGAVVIPTETLERVASQLEQHGRVRRGYLGVGTQAVRLPAPIAARTGTGSALLILSVEPGAPADTAGLQFGDAIVSVDGKKVDDVEELFTLLSEDKIGSTLPLEVFRAGAVVQTQINVGQRP